MVRMKAYFRRDGAHAELVGTQTWPWHRTLLCGLVYIIKNMAEKKRKEKLFRDVYCTYYIFVRGAPEVQSYCSKIVQNV